MFGNKRREDRKGILIRYVDYITRICSMANPSGILAMRFMNSKGGKKNWKEASSVDYLSNHPFDGGVTRIGTSLKKRILDKFVMNNPNQTKPLLVLIFTDGTVYLSSDISKAIYLSSENRWRARNRAVCKMSFGIV